MKKDDFHIYWYRQTALILLTMTIVSYCNAQKNDLKSDFIEQRIEEIAETGEEDEQIDFTELFENLTYYFENPINLNNASANELRELYLLNDFQINNLINHIHHFGPLLSKFELQAVESFDISTIRRIDDFITIQPVAELKDISMGTIWRESHTDFFLRYKRTLEQQKGYLPNPNTGFTPFAGSPDYFFSRYRLQFRNNLKLGFTLEQDAGESLKNGIDFRSVHFIYSGKGRLKNLIIGDFQALFGQGLTLWNGLGFGKSPFILNAKKNTVGLHPYSSVQEFNYFRGGAATIGLGKFEFTTFFSYKKMDGVQTNNNGKFPFDAQTVITSLPISGLHRTSNELANRKTLNEQVIGGHCRFNKRVLSIGTTFAHSRYSFPIQQNQALYRKYRFAGDENIVVGLDYQAVLRNVNFFGEVSRSANGGFAILNGLIASLHSKLAVSLIHRRFDKDFQNMYVSAFGDNTTTASNEGGLFAGIEASLNNKWSLNGYVDLVKYPWLRYRIDAPSVSTDYLVQFNYRPDRKHEFYVRYRTRIKEQNLSSDDVLITYPVGVRQDNWRIHGTYHPHPNVRMKTRIEYVHYFRENYSSTGFLMYQEVAYKKLGSRWSAIGRYSLFDTQDWDSRIYTYETDVLYSYSIPAYSGKGMRCYAMVKLSPWRGVDLWMRYGVIVYIDRTVVSSGNTEILGNQKSDVTAQLRWRF